MPSKHVYVTFFLVGGLRRGHLQNSGLDNVYKSIVPKQSSTTNELIKILDISLFADWVGLAPS